MELMDDTYQNEYIIKPDYHNLEIPKRKNEHLLNIKEKEEEIKEKLVPENSPIFEQNPQPTPSYNYFLNGLNQLNPSFTNQNLDENLVLKYFNNKDKEKENNETPENREVLDEWNNQIKNYKKKLEIML